MHWLSYVVAALFLLLGAACVFLVIVQLPGGWMILGLAALIEWADRLYLPSDSRQTFDWWVLWTCLGLLVLGEVLEFVAGAAGAKRGGSSRRGMWGALIGGVLGAFLLTGVFFFVPLFSTLLGAVLGTFVGAIIGEMTGRDPRGVGGSMKPALGATAGRVAGTAGKVGIATVVWLVLAASAFIP